MCSNKNGPSSFLFINKNSSNLNTRNKKEIFEVGSWVQTGSSKTARGRRGKKLQIKLLTPSNYDERKKGASIDFKVSQKPSNALYQSKSVETDPRNQALANISQIVYVGADITQCCARDEENNLFIKRKHVPQSKNLEKRSCVLMSGPTTLLNSGNSDPFNASILPIDKHTSNLITIAFKYHASVVWALEAHLGQDSVALSTWWNSLTNSLGHEGLMASFFGYASALKEQLQMTKFSKVPVELGATTLSYKTTAITVLRNQLAEGDLKLSSLQIVTRLMRLEAYSFYPGVGKMNMQTCKMHMQAAKHIVAGLGGLTALPWSQREFLVAADTNLSFILGEKPVFSVEDWDPGSFLEFMTSSDVEASIRCTILEELDSLSPLDHIYGFCDEIVSPLLIDLGEALAVEKILRIRLKNGYNYAAGYRWLQPRITACRNRLNTYYLDNVVQIVEELQDNYPTYHRSQDFISQRRKIMSACVCIAAMLCERMVFYENPEMLNRWNTFSSMQHALNLCLVSFCTEYQSDMAASKDSILQQGSSIILWATCILMIMPTTGIKRIEVPHKDVREFLDFLTSSLSLGSSEDVTQVCRTIIWHDRVMTPPLAQVLQGALPNPDMSHYRMG